MQPKLDALRSSEMITSGTGYASENIWKSVGRTSPLLIAISTTESAINGRS